MRNRLSHRMASERHVFAIHAPLLLNFYSNNCHYQAVMMLLLLHRGAYTGIASQLVGVLGRNAQKCLRFTHKS
jgi:hypothetical protein